MCLQNDKNKKTVQFVTETSKPMPCPKLEWKLKINEGTLVNYY